MNTTAPRRVRKYPKASIFHKIFDVAPGIFFFFLKNFSPDFLIQYEDLLHQPGVWTNLTEVDGTSTTVQLSLSPHVYYSFRVLAMNRLGYSEPSQPSNQYRTNPAGERPEIKRNPIKACKNETGLSFCS